MFQCFHNFVINSIRKRGWMETQKNNFVRPAQKNSQELLGNLPNFSDRFQEKSQKYAS